jgi:hypothetical protein
LSALCSLSKAGSHEVLINEIVRYIRDAKKPNCATHMNDYCRLMGQLKYLRVKADYGDSIFDSAESSITIDLSDKIILILRKYQ